MFVVLVLVQGFIQDFVLGGGGEIHLLVCNQNVTEPGRKSSQTETFENSTKDCGGEMRFQTVLKCLCLATLSPWLCDILVAAVGSNSTGTTVKQISG